MVVMAKTIDTSFAPVRPVFLHLPLSKHGEPAARGRDLSQLSSGRELKLSNVLNPILSQLQTLMIASDALGR